MKTKLLFLIISLNFFACSSKKQTIQFNYEIECVGRGVGGSPLIKVWGVGKNPDIAIVEAKKNAVHAIIFKGINAGNPGCMKNPLISDLNAEKKYEEYFNNFFSESGKYLNYVEITNDGSINPNDRIKLSKGYKIGLIVSVNQTALRKELEFMGIIKSLDSGF
jgi:hypothetical protein